jgi:hypothetical protein
MKLIHYVMQYFVTFTHCAATFVATLFFYLLIYENTSHTVERTFDLMRLSMWPRHILVTLTCALYTVQCTQDSPVLRY